MLTGYQPPTPDDDERDEVVERPTKYDPLDWRVTQYLRLGFTYAQALMLASAKDDVGMYLWWADVERLLALCGDHALVVEIRA